MARTLVPGSATGPALVLREPLSFWGGVREHDGVIIDVHHPQHDACVAHTVLVMPAGRGSSSSSSVLAELARGGVAPRAILLGESDPILAIGAMVAQMLYAVTIPVLVLSPAEYQRAVQASQITLTAEGIVDFDV